ncbi:MAG: hypothetical protein ABR964_09485 [Tepidisphaeraceae bacterium]|jgi:SAM-dependent methyltransferase
MPVIVPPPDAGSLTALLDADKLPIVLAISALEYGVIFTLRSNGVLPPKPRVLELGESNWYGDVSTNQLADDIRKYVPDSAQQAELTNALEEIVKANRPDMSYEVARIFFRAGLDYSTYAAIDPTTPSATYRYNLNIPVPLQEQFDITLNLGTAEHIFNVQQFFKTVHDRTAPGGLMIHTAPCTGWLDHGFFNFQPTFFYDLAHVNQYQILLCVCAELRPWRSIQIASHEHFGALMRDEKLPKNSLINIVFKKPSPAGIFAIPNQGIYGEALSPELKHLWEKGR